MDNPEPTLPPPWSRTRRLLVGLPLVFIVLVVGYCLIFGRFRSGDGWWNYRVRLEGSYSVILVHRPSGEFTFGVYRSESWFKKLKGGHISGGQKQIKIWPKDE